MKTSYITYVATFEKESDSEAEKKLGIVEVQTTFKNMTLTEPFTLLDIKNKAREDCGVEEFQSFMLLGITEFRSSDHFSRFFSHPIPPADK